MYVRIFLQSEDYEQLRLKKNPTVMMWIIREVLISFLIHIRNDGLVHDHAGGSVHYGLAGGE